MEDLADETVLHILRYLPAQSVGSMACVSSRLHRLAMDESIWRSLYDALCPPCLDSSVCMAHKGQGLDSAPWSSGSGAHAADPRWAQLVAHPYPSHPLYPILRHGSRNREAHLQRFVNTPAFACPHHCPSITGARGFRWAYASQCVPPRSIDATGVRVGCGPVCPLGVTLTHTVYRGEWHRDENVLDGLGMLASHRRWATLAVGFWQQGKQVGFAREWTNTLLTVSFFDCPASYREGFFGPEESAFTGTSVDVAVRTPIESVATRIDAHRVDRKAHVVTMQHRVRLRSGSMVVPPADPHNLYHALASYLLYDDEDRLAYRGSLGRYDYGFASQKRGTLYHRDQSVLYAGTLYDGSPRHCGTLHLYGSDGPVTIMAFSWMTQSGVDKSMVYLDGAASVTMALGDTINTDWRKPAHQPCLALHLCSFRPGPTDPDDFASIPIQRITDWELAYDVEGLSIIKADVARAEARFAQTTEFTCVFENVAQYGALFFWPRLGSRLAPLVESDSGRSSTTDSTATPAIDDDDDDSHCECVSATHMRAFVSAMRKRHPQWARCQALVDAMLAADP